MMPAWMNPRQLPMQRSRTIRPSTVILVLVVLALIGYIHVDHTRVRPFWSSVAELTKSDFLVLPEDFDGTPEPVTSHEPFKLPNSTIFDLIPEPIAPRTPSLRVPNSVHLVFGLMPPPEGDSGPDYPYWAYLAFRSIMLKLKPQQIFFYYGYKPQGPYWDAMVPHLTLVKVPIPTEIFGQPVGNYAHAADVIRLYAVQKAGGIYLDIDVFVLKSFDELLTYPVTMGQEAIHWDDDSRKTAGLCNGVIIAEPDAQFINRWIDQYQDFDTKEWAHHSVHLPWHLARHWPSELQVLNATAFFKPLWTAEDVEQVHTRDDYDFFATQQYAFHAWESQSRKYMDKLTPASIREQNTSFKRLVLPMMGPNDDDLYEQWVKWRRAHGRDQW